MSSKGFRPDIEGLRGIAVLLVVLYHSKVNWFSGGFIGVDVFFVLSGYLITRLLVTEVEQSGRLNLPGFYARRVRRLLPASMLMLMTVLLTGVLIYAPDELFFLARAARGTVLYASNIFFGLNSANYFAPTVESNAALHTWSLAVEEQFYLGWPLLIFGVMRFGKSRKVLLATMIVLTAASFARCVFLTGQSSTWAFYGLPSRAWEFGIGGIGTLLFLSYIRNAAFWTAAGVTGVAMVIGAGMCLNANVAFPGWVALLPGIGTVFALMSGAQLPGGPVVHLLSWRPLLVLGKLSYSWYLWHWPALLALNAINPEAGTGYRLLAVSVALVIAAITHWSVENPIRFHPVLSRRTGLTLGLAACLTLVGLSVAQFVLWQSQRMERDPRLKAIHEATLSWSKLPQNCIALTYPNRPLNPCVLMNPASRVTLAVLGDSHMAQLARPLESIAARRGWRLVYITAIACGAADLNVNLTPRQLRTLIAGCGEWRHKAIQYLTELRPNLVLTSSNRMAIAYGGETPEILQEWRRATRATLEPLNAANIRVMLLRDNPMAHFSVPACMARSTIHHWYTAHCELDRKTALSDGVYAAELDAARGLKNVQTVDLSDRFCGPATCPPVIDGVFVMCDEHHITSEFAAHLESQLEERLTAAIRKL